jgi:AraC-like DNA-binding protein
MLTMPKPAPSPAQEAHHAAAVHYARRHFTDPDLTAADAAIFFNISERTQRESLSACGTSWREIVHGLRLERAAELLSTTKFEVWAVARLSGYKSAPALAVAFKQRHRSSPAQFRRGHGGPQRAGGPTGAFYRPTERARAMKAGNESPRRDGWSAGDRAVLEQRVEEARERIADRRVLAEARTGAMSIDELTDEMEGPQHLRDDPAGWRRRRAELDAWVETNSREPDEEPMPSDWS